MISLRYCIFAILLLTGSLACQKELSYENLKEKARGSLQSDVSGDCLPKTLGGNFIVDKAITDSNFIQVDINVSSIGSYAISTEIVNGYSFEATGVFSSTGIVTIKLKGKGKPLTPGTDLFALSFDSSSCLVQVSVLPASAGNPASGTLVGSPSACMTATVSGNYTQGTALTSSNTVQIQVNVTTVGTYSIATNTVNGIIFSKSGSFTATGLQNIILNGTGTPSAAGNATFNVNFGSSSCSFPVPVDAGTTPPPTSPFFWKFTEAGITYQGIVEETDAQFASTPTPLGIISLLGFLGTTTVGDTTLTFALIDFAGGISNNETYNSSATTNNGASLQFESSPGNILYTAQSTTTGVNMLMKVTNHNIPAKQVEGTFSGTAKTSSGAVKTITNGQFKVQYQ